MKTLTEILWAFVTVMAIIIAIAFASGMYFGSLAYGADASLASTASTSGIAPTISQDVAKAVNDSVERSSWDFWDLIIPSSIKDMNAETAMLVGLMFMDACNWGLTQTRYVKWQQENEAACTDPSNCTAGGVVSTQGNMYPMSPLLGTNPSKQDINVYYTFAVISELAIYAFMPEILRGINWICRKFQPVEDSHDVIPVTEKNIKKSRITVTGLMLGWEMGSTCYGLTVKKEF